MFNLELELVDPLYRPPLSLAVLAAALKFVATAWVLDDPLLKTSAVLRRERETATVQTGQVRRLCLRALFLLLAANVLVRDIALVVEAFLHFEGLRRIHAVALVLAFSPNTVAAVAASCVVELKVGWSRSLPLQGSWCAVLSELLALVYGAVLGFAYAGPLFLVSMSHAVVGAAVVGYAFAYDFLTLPWRLFSGDMKEIWIAVPVVNACVLWTVLYTCIVIGYFWLVSRRYPELEPQRGYRAKVLEQMPHQVAARIIGMAQNGGLKMRPEVEMDDMPLNTELEAQQEKCIINDEGLMLLCGAKVLLCLSLPLVQLCVVVAAQVYLGESAWNAANLTFQERTWQHYMHSLSRFALERPLSLAWLYV